MHRTYRKQASYQDSPKAHTFEPKENFLTQKSPQLRNTVLKGIYPSHTWNIFYSNDTEIGGSIQKHVFVHKCSFHLDIMFQSLQN